jgi:catechol 2,3-dioxygenase-like lactoylglutathione lyase family enzyme
MFDHVGIAVGDWNRSKRFYENALAPLSITIVMEVSPEQTGGGALAGFGKDGKAFFWIGSAGRTGGPVHFAFSAPSRADVDAFYRAAIAAGGRDNGAPGLRPEYHDHYYGAFVFDPDGNNIEAVCHQAG